MISETGNNDPKGSSLDPYTGFIYIFNLDYVMIKQLLIVLL